MIILRMFLVSLVLTLIIETVVALFWKVRMPGLIVVWLVNTLTNPPAVLLAWQLVRLFPGISSLVIQLPIECIVILVEALIYCGFAKKEKWTIRHPGLLSVTANVISWSIGLMIRTFR
ncbi:MAG: hypothetical protein J5589_05165 [Firmicutes bacterium]|nr:hypothetical protein [Bacillota bacterium]